MGKDTKFILGAFIFTLLVVIGLAFLVSSKEKKTGTLSEVKAEGIALTPLNYELGEVPIKGGIVTKEYEVKNETGGDIELLKIATSCMCTTASAKVGEDETRFFGMEMVGDKNPLLSLKLKNGGTAKISVQFDPAAHGPEGVGPFERVVWLYFDNGVKELTFNGTVIK